MVHFLGLVMPSDTTIGTFVSEGHGRGLRQGQGRRPQRRQGDRRSFRARPAALLYKNLNVPVFKGKIAVLVNSGSGSASEITAEALKETLNAPIVGTKSAGAVLVSVMVPVVRGFQVQYPINDYVSAKGVRLEHNGVVPDIEAKTPQEIMPGKADPAWQYALQLAEDARPNSGNGAIESPAAIRSPGFI